MYALKSAAYNSYISVISVIIHENGLMSIKSKRKYIGIDAQNLKKLLPDQSHKWSSFEANNNDYNNDNYSMNYTQIWSTALGGDEKTPGKPRAHVSPSQRLKLKLTASKLERDVTPLDKIQCIAMRQK